MTFYFAGLSHNLPSGYVLPEKAHHGLFLWDIPSHLHCTQTMNPESKTEQT